MFQREKKQFGNSLPTKKKNVFFFLEKWESEPQCVTFQARTQMQHSWAREQNPERSKTKESGTEGWSVYLGGGAVVVKGQRVRQNSRDRSRRVRVPGRLAGWWAKVKGWCIRRWRKIWQSVTVELGRKYWGWWGDWMQVWLMRRLNAGENGDHDTMKVLSWGEQLQVLPPRVVFSISCF